MADTGMREVPNMLVPVLCRSVRLVARLLVREAWMSGGIATGVIEWARTFLAVVSQEISAVKHQIGHKTTRGVGNGLAQRARGHVPHQLPYRVP